jgi:hypothetical protein
MQKPLRRVFIEKKGKNKKRPLGIPTMYNRAMQTLYGLALEPVAEPYKRPYVQEKLEAARKFKAALNILRRW